MKYKFNKIIIAGLLAGTSLVACKEKLDVLDQNSPTTESYFKTAAELQNGVNAIYSSLRSAQLVGREWFFLHDMRGSETNAGGPQLEAPRAELLFQTNGAPSNSVLTDVWTGAYRMINRANTVIAKAPGVTDNTTLRDQLVGEAKFLRAWAYFELVSQWGDVPLYTEPATSASGYKGKSPAADVYALVIADLTAASTALPVTASQQGRATKGAADALLGRVQMQKGDYAAAKTALEKVVASNQYALVPFMQNFGGDIIVGGQQVGPIAYEFNKESIFEVAFIDKGDNNFNWAYQGEGISAPVSTVRNQEYGITWGNVIPSNRILNEFEAGDPRFKMTFWEEGDRILTYETTKPGKVMTAADMNVAASNRNGDVKKRVFRKYSVLDWDDNGFHPAGINQRLIRYADVLLMLAECEAEVGTPAKAAEYINMVRSRPGVNMPPVVVASKNDAIKAVMHERAVELAGEEVNNIDILRWKKKGYIPSLMADPRPNQQEFLPVPAAEVAANPLIK